MRSMRCAAAEMDSTTLWIVSGSTVVFVGLLGWKVVWLLRKINRAPAPQDENR